MLKENVAFIVAFALLAFVFVVAALALLVGAALFFAIVPTLKRDLNKVTNGVTSVTLATTKTLAAIQALIVKEGPTLQNTLLKAGDTIMVLKNGVDNGLYTFDATNRTLTKTLDNGDHTVANINKGFHAASTVMMHPAQKRQRLAPATFRAVSSIPWLDQRHATYDNTVLTSNTETKSFIPLINGKVITNNYLNMSMTIKQFAVDEALLVFHMRTPGAIPTFDPADPLGPVSIGISDSSQLFVGHELVPGAVIYESLNIIDLHNSNVDNVLCHVNYNAATFSLEVFDIDKVTPVAAHLIRDGAVNINLVVTMKLVPET